MSKEKILGCPFCGRKPDPQGSSEDRYFGFFCNSFGHDVSVMAINRKKAVESWNERHLYKKPDSKDRPSSPLPRAAYCNTDGF